MVENEKKFINWIKNKYHSKSLAESYLNSLKEVAILVDVRISTKSLHTQNDINELLHKLSLFKSKESLKTIEKVLAEYILMAKENN